MAQVRCSESDSWIGIAQRLVRAKQLEPLGRVSINITRQGSEFVGLRYANPTYILAVGTSAATGKGRSTPSSSTCRIAPTRASGGIP